jgi:hypothetical protein
METENMLSNFMVSKYAPLGVPTNKTLKQTIIVVSQGVQWCCISRLTFDSLSPKDDSLKLK